MISTHSTWVAQLVSTGQLEHQELVLKMKDTLKELAKLLSHMMELKLEELRGHQPCTAKHELKPLDEDLLKMKNTLKMSIP